MKRLGLSLLAATALASTVLAGSAGAAPASSSAATSSATAPGTATSSSHQPKETPPPGPVTQLRAIGNGLHSITLSWATATGSDRANVLIRRAAGDQPPLSATDGTLVAALGKGKTTFTDRQLAAGTTYSYAVYAVGRNHRPSTPATVTATTRTTDAHTGIRGVLTDQQGNPIVGSWVNIFSLDGGYGGTFTTDGSGRFTATNVQPGNYQVCFEPLETTTGPSATGYLPGCYSQKPFSWSGTGTTVPVVAGHVTSGIHDYLHIAGAISGRLTDPRGGPIEGAYVYVQTTQPPYYEPYETTTAANGSYVLKNLPTGSYPICFGTSGLTGPSGTGLLDQCWQNRPPNAEPLPIAVTEGQNRTGIDAVLAEGGAVAGHIQDETGAPAPGVFLQLMPYTSWSNELGTDQQGNYREIGIPPGSYHACFDGTFASTTNAPYGYATSCGNADDPGFNLVARQTVTQNGTVHRAGAIGGTVRGVDGPLDGVWVSVQDAMGYDFISTSTYNGGSWQIAGLPPGSYTVCYDPTWSGGGYLRGCYVDSVTVGATGKPVQVTTAQLTTVNASLHLGASLTGSVTDATGAPISGVAVTAYPLTGGDSYYGQTDDTGTYTLSGVAPGSYAVCFDTSNAHGTSPGGYLGECFDNELAMETADPVAVGDTGSVTVDAVLAAGSGISGRVTDQAGIGLWNVAVEAYAGSQALAVYTDENGNYTIGGLPDGQAYVCFDGRSAIGGGSSTGYVPECYDNHPGTYGGDPVAVGGGGLVTGIDAVLDAGAEITGTVRDSAGNGVSEVSVNATSIDGTYLPDAWGYTDQYGDYTITGLPSTTVTVCFQPPPWGGSNDTGYLSQCYDGAPDDVSASLITLGPGAVASGIDAILQDAPAW